jgi:hypothetical protein
MKESGVSWFFACAAVLTVSTPVLGRIPSTPIAHESGTPAQRKRRESGGAFCSVRKAKEEMVSNLGAKDFLVTDNGIPQKITYLDFGAEPVCGGRLGRN